MTYNTFIARKLRPLDGLTNESMSPHTGNFTRGESFGGKVSQIKIV